MTPIERVRAALNHAEECARNEYSRHIYKETLRELEGMCIVPVEPTDKQTDLAIEMGLCVRLTADYTWRDYMRDLYKAIIAQYVNADKLAKVGEAMKNSLTQPTTGDGE